MCLSSLNEEKDWIASITIKQILVGIQRLLDEPNLDDPAQAEAYHCLKDDPEESKRKVREQARVNAAE